MADKRKKLNVQILDRARAKAEYKLLDDLIATYHNHLAEAQIALAWHLGWKPNTDGQLQLGKAKKSSDVDRELHTFDFVILLNRHIWQGDFSAAQQRALLDHELCHCQIAQDRKGQVKLDETGRPVWRIRKHDVAEFQAIAQRHGLWKSDLVKFATAAQRKKRTPLLKTG